MKLHPLVRDVAALRFENCFNPYSDRCEIHDRRDAPHRRAAVLSTILRRASKSNIEAIWIGRDLGYRGGRRTGLALTDDANMARHGQRWQVSAERSTIGELVAERTAAVIWNMLDKIECNVFLWNVFPLHPHELEKPFTNRRHNAKEREAGERILASLLTLLRPSRVLAIGSDAANSARKVATRVPVIKVRHPSYGGQNQFIGEIAAIYKAQLKNKERQLITES